jgi:hypothetical protein
MRTAREMCDLEEQRLMTEQQTVAEPETIASQTKQATTMTRSIIAKNIRAIAGFFKVGAAVLQEVFDESAYRRFLVRGNLVSSSASYAAFWAEQEKSRARRPRCC